MKLLIQEKGECGLESVIVEEVAERCGVESVKAKTGKLRLVKGLEDWTPVGDLWFVSKYLEEVGGKPEPMEALGIPDCLMEERFLKRKAWMTDGSGVPLAGRWFVKDLFETKGVTFCGSMSFSKRLLDFSGDRFLVSEEVDVLSEWRLYVLRGELGNACCYSGDPLLFPDTVLCREMMARLKESLPDLKSYTLDVMITPKGTAVLEVQPFASVGLYGTVWDERLLAAYGDGIEWYLSRGRAGEFVV